MSLLSGIKFVPRDKKKSPIRDRSPSPELNSEDENENKRISRYNEKKRSKGSHSRDTKRYRSYSISSDSDIDLKDIIEEERVKERELYKRSDSRDRHRDRRTDSRDRHRSRRDASRDRRDASRDRRDSRRDRRDSSRDKHSNKRTDSRERRNDSKDRRDDIRERRKDSRDRRDRSSERSVRRASEGREKTSEVQHEKEQTFNKEKLKSMLLGLKSFSGKESSQPVSTPKEPIASNESTAVEMFEHIQPSNSAPLPSEESAQASISSIPVTSVARPSTNEGVAALLRARLKTSQGVVRTLDLPKPDISPLPPSSNDDDLDVRKQMLLLQKQYTLAQSSSGNTSDSANDLQSMRFKEKYNKEDEDMDNIYRDNILKLGKHYKGTELSAGDKAGRDEDAEIDMKLFQKKATNSLDAMQKQLEAREKEKALYNSAIKNCRLCHGNDQFILYQNENLVVRLKSQPYTLVSGHVEIIPKIHVKSFVSCSDEVKDDIRIVKKSLANYYKTLGSSMISFETCLNFNRMPHTSIEALPIPHDLLTETYMAFKEAFVSSDDEWTQHRKVIEITKDRPLERAIPLNFSYLTVDWLAPASNLPCCGLVHPVETDSNYSHSFCYDVAASLLEEDPYKMRKGKPFDPNEQQREFEQLKSSLKALLQ